MKRMNKPTVLPWFRLGFAFLAFAAIVVQLFDSIGHSRSVAHFFSFFTVESNILAATLFLLIGLAGLVKLKDKNISFLRGAITLYMTMTGIIYIVLLSGNEIALQTTIPWVNMVLHYIMPVAVLVDWLLFPPRTRIPYKKALMWLSFPLLYVLYSLVRGPLVGWYPYPFLDPRISGWAPVIVTSVGICVGVLGLIKVLTLRSQR